MSLGFKKGFKFRLYPNKAQIDLLERTFGCCRFVWNASLAKNIEDHEAWKNGSDVKADPSGYGMVKNLVALKYENQWLYDVSAAALQQTILDLGSAFTHFFKEKKGCPKFKKKQDKQSFRIGNQFFRIKDDKFFINKSKQPIKVIWSRQLLSEPSSVTISKDRSGRYFASFICEVIPDVTNGQGIIGVDLGIKDFAVLSTGEKIPNPRHYVSQQKKLKRAQRQLARKQKGSKNRNKARIKVAKIHAKITDQRNDFQHKLSTRLVRENQAIGIESLKVVNMLKNRKLSKHIGDASWGSFIGKLIYKAEESQWCQLIHVHEWFPSSHICSSCGTKLNRKLSLNERQWICSCGELHDRDVNASVVILRIVQFYNRIEAALRGASILTPDYDQLRSMGLFQ